MARTLSVGRHHFAHRCAIVATGAQAAKDELRKAASQGTSIHIRRGTLARDHEANPVVVELVSAQAIAAAAPDTPAAEQLKALRTLAEFYCQGYEIPAPATGSVLLHLPGYPFARTQFWAGRTDARWTTKTEIALVETLPAPSAERAPATSIEAAFEGDPSDRAAPCDGDGDGDAPALACHGQTDWHHLGIDAPLVIDHAASPRTAQTHVAAQDVVDELAELLAAELFVEAEDVDPDRSFVEMGLDSILAVEWIQAVNRRFGLSVSTTRIYELPTLRQFAALVASNVHEPSQLAMAPPTSAMTWIPCSRQSIRARWTRQRPMT